MVDRPTFQRISMGLSRDGTLSADCKAVLLSVASYAGADGWAWPSQHVIAADTGLSIRQVQRCLSQLEQKKLIVIERGAPVGRVKADGHRRAANRYRICSDVRRLEATDNRRLVVVHSAGNGRQGVVHSAGNGRQGVVHSAGNGRQGVVHSAGNGRQADPGMGDRESHEVEPSEVEDARARVRAHLLTAVGESNYRLWLGMLAERAIDDGRLTLIAPSRFHAEWCGNHYRHHLLDAYRLTHPRIDRVEIAVEQPSDGEAVSAEPSEPERFGTGEGSAA